MITRVERHNSSPADQQAAQAASDVAVADAKKVVVPPAQAVGWKAQDSIAPATEQTLVEKMRDTAVAVEGAATSEKSYAASAYEQLSDWAWWIWNTVTGASPEAPTADTVVDKTNPFHVGKEPQHLSVEERQELRKFIREMNQLVDKLKSAFDDATFDEIMKLIMKQAMETKKEAKDLGRQVLAKKYEELNGLQKQRLKEAEVLLERTKSSMFWGKCEQLTTTLGLTTAALGSLGSGWAVAGLFYAAGSTFNSYHDHWVERQLAKGVAWTGSLAFGLDPKKTERSAHDYIKAGIGVTSLLIAAFGMSSPHAVGQIAQNASQVVHAVTQHQTERSQGALQNLNWKLGVANQGVGSGIKQWGQLDKQIQLLWKMLKRQASNQHQAIQALFR